MLSRASVFQSPERLSCLPRLSIESFDVAVRAVSASHSELGKDCQALVRRDNDRDNPVAANKLKIKIDAKCDLGSSHCYPALSQHYLKVHSLQSRSRKPCIRKRHYRSNSDHLGGTSR